MSDETVVLRVDNVALVLTQSSSNSERDCVVTLDDFRRFAGDVSGSVQLAVAPTKVVKEGERDALARLFGSWVESGDEDDHLKNIYESRMIAR